MQLPSTSFSLDTYNSLCFQTIDFAKEPMKIVRTRSTGSQGLHLFALLPFLFLYFKDNRLQQNKTEQSQSKQSGKIGTELESRILGK